jgi:hypothetical protein
MAVKRKAQEGAFYRRPFWPLRDPCVLSKERQRRPLYNGKRKAQEGGFYRRPLFAGSASSSPLLLLHS